MILSALASGQRVTVAGAAGPGLWMWTNCSVLPVIMGLMPSASGRETRQELCSFPNGPAGGPSRPGPPFGDPGQPEDPGPIPYRRPTDSKARGPADLPGPVVSDSDLPQCTTCASPIPTSRRRDGRQPGRDHDSDTRARPACTQAGRGTRSLPGDPAQWASGQPDSVTGFIRVDLGFNLKGPRHCQCRGSRRRRFRPQVRTV
jgi:hypothetical protein